MDLQFSGAIELLVACIAGALALSCPLREAERRLGTSGRSLRERGTSEASGVRLPERP